MTHHAATVVAAGTSLPLRAVDTVGLSGPTTSASTGEGVDLVGHKRIVADDPYLEGHFPDRTIFPGVFVLESVRQTAALALPAAGERSADRVTPDVREVRSMRFLAPLVPGDTLSVRARVSPPTSGGWPVTARCERDDGTVVATVDAVLGAAPVEPGRPGPRCPTCLLPHGHPMVLVDRVLDLQPGRSVVAVKAVSASEPCYRDHPAASGSPFGPYPSSLVVESFGQAAAVLWLDSTPAAPPAEELLMLAVVRNCRIVGAARPGDVLRHVVRFDRQIGDTAFVEGETYVDEQPVMVVGSMVAVRRPPAEVHTTCPTK